MPVYIDNSFKDGKRMFWIVQENISNEIGFEKLIQALERRSLPFKIVKLIPFSHEIAPEPCIPEGSVIVSGSPTLSKIAMERAWQPGAFLNDNFDFSVWQEKYKGLLLNEDARIEEFGKLNPKEPIFVRPCSDHKTFAGFIIEPENLQTWQQQILGISDGYATLTPETLVLSATPKPILKEFRFFVVDKQIVTWSLYKTWTYAHSSSDCDDEVVAFAEKAVQVWQPDRAFVIDIALTPIGPKVIEINCLTSAGFYEADVDHLVETLERTFG
jgi:hypothetical protein